MRWIALMPLRAGSKSIANKNIREMAGRPLFAWGLQAAVESRCFDEIFVASDSAAIRERVATEFGDKVTVIDRSLASASDSAASEIVMLELADRGDFDVMALIQATSPLTEARDFIAARAAFERGGYDSLLSAVPFKRFLWNAEGEPLNYAPQARPLRQNAPVQYLENGAFYFTTAVILREQACRIAGRTAIHMMSEETATEVDEAADWDVVERLLLRRLARSSVVAMRYPLAHDAAGAPGERTGGVR